VHDFIRGLSPLPGAFTYLHGKSVKLFDSRIYEESNNLSELVGTIVDFRDKRIIIQCSKSSISVAQIQVEGKRIMTIEDYLRGHKLEKGTGLGNKDR
jgi:methionyl-tRNA formyltransferase